MAKCGWKAKSIEFENIQPQLDGKRLLIVDDNPTNRQLLTLQAQSWGMITRAARSGAEALVWLEKEESFDIAILDTIVPEMDGLSLAAKISQQPNYQNLPLIMLASIGKSEISNYSAAVKFAAFLTKPIAQSHLFNVLNEVLGGQPIKLKSARSNEFKINTHLATEIPVRILLAEDNIINQKVALYLLQMMGYKADVVRNGLEAIEALRRQSYDVVLMDVQMPKMDGLSATRYICREFPASSRPRIIAMTANAMQGDREICLEAGMDDYISKPVRVEELVRAFQKCLLRKEAGVQSHRRPVRWGEDDRSSTLNSKLSILSPPIDAKVFQSFQKMVGDNSAAFIAEMIDCYLEDSPKLIEAIASAIAAENAVQLRQASHTLKGSSLTLGAVTLSNFCKELEILGRDGNTKGGLEKLLLIEAEYERVKAALQIKRHDIEL